MRAWCVAALAAVCLVAVVLGDATIYTPTDIALPKTRCLIVTDNATHTQTTLRAFIAAMESKGFVFHYINPAKVKKIEVERYGEYLYNNVILAAPTRTVGVDLVDFVDDGNNLIIAGGRFAEKGATLSEELRAEAAEFGMRFSTSIVTDFGKPKGGIESMPLLKNDRIFPVQPTNTITDYTGLGIQAEAANPLVVPIASAQATARSPSASKKKGAMYGTTIQLVTAMQTRVGSRATFFGSLDLLVEQPAMAADVASWTFQARGMLRHHSQRLVEIDPTTQTEVPRATNGQFRAGCTLRYEFTVEEFQESAWVPWAQPSADPLQISFVMMQPYAVADVSDLGAGKYRVDFETPAQYGVFKLLVDYRRVGYNHLLFKEEVTMRPPRSDEHPRFLPVAYPYYLSVFAAWGGFILLCVFLVGTPDETQKLKTA